MFKLSDRSGLTKAQREHEQRCIELGSRVMGLLIEQLATKTVNGKPLGVEHAAGHVLVGLMTAALDGLEIDYGTENVQ